MQRQLAELRQPQIALREELADGYAPLNEHDDANRECQRGPLVDDKEVNEPGKDGHSDMVQGVSFQVRRQR
jgi:hypothetical protein